MDDILSVNVRTTEKDNFFGDRHIFSDMDEASARSVAKTY
jgi:hypothetical protein